MPSLQNGLTTITQYQKSYLFIVRVWREGMTLDHNEWRGQVRFVMNGETSYFREWSALVKIIENTLLEMDLKDE